MTSALERLTASYLDLRWYLNPVDASAEGVASEDHRFGSFTADDITEHVAALTSLSHALEEAPVDTLDDEIDRTALLNHLRSTIQIFVVEQPHRHNPDWWLTHILEGLYILLVRADRPAPHRTEAARQRLEAIPAFLELAQGSLDDCPDVFVDTAARTIGPGLELVDRVIEVLGMPDMAWSSLRDQARSALASFGHWLDGQRGAEATFAIGEPAFTHRLQFQHALNTTPREVGEYGAKLVQQTEHELEQLAKQIDGQLAWPDLLDRFRADHPRRDELLGAYQHQMESARRFTEEEGLVTVPAGSLDVVPTPDFLATVIPFAAYQPPGMMASSTTGTFYVTRPREDLDEAGQSQVLRDHCNYELSGTALHEAYPGHHLHFLTMQGGSRVIRKVVTTPVTVEGWALYCEEMMGEQGFYTSLEEQLFQKRALLWRGMRILLDVGLHTLGLTVDEAVGALASRVHFDRQNAEAEVLRYCGSPTYQLSYAVGRRELLKLRADYLGTGDNERTLRSFHDAVLGYGGLPVSMMRWGMGL